jgi:hypothetical protein
MVRIGAVGANRGRFGALRKKVANVLPRNFLGLAAFESCPRRRQISALDARGRRCFTRLDGFPQISVGQIVEAWGFFLKPSREPNLLLWALSGIHFDAIAVRDLAGACKTDIGISAECFSFGFARPAVAVAESPGLDAARCHANRKAATPRILDLDATRGWRRDPE